MMKRQISILFFFMTCCVAEIVADNYPTIEPMAYIQTDEGEEVTTSYAGSAPLTVRFVSNTVDNDGWTAHYEWRFTMEGELNPYLVRYDEETEVKFTKAGSHRVELYAKFTRDDEVVEYTEEYWTEMEPLRITISESRLDMPNAFSPNGDGINDIYKAKEGWQSLVEFKATIFNRWGQKLYEWTNPSDGWDGTFKGRPVAQGVYYVVVNAKGSDGLKYTFKQDVNLLRGYREENK